MNSVFATPAIDAILKVFGYRLGVGGGWGWVGGGGGGRGISNN